MPCSDDCALSENKGWQGKSLYSLNGAVIEKGASIGYKQSWFCDMTNVNGEKKKKKPLQVRVSLRNKTSPGLFSGLSSALLPRYMGLKSCMKKRRRKKTFPFCPLCEFNGVIYDDEGGNVWRGTWRKPAEDKIIKQDVGNTHTDVNEARSRSIIKRLFLVLVKADGRPPISRGLLRLLMKECWVSVN